ncbi:MAG: hypothetical protein DIU72_006070 [Pseudomonadota bacterium]|nr:MAG: hypothetical protein DIU72_10390 [Pseudomonadota bacterium]
MLIRVAVVLPALFASILFQEIALRLRAQERSAWWASNGRDVANALALALLLFAIRWLGASWDVALLLGATITLALTALARALLGMERRIWVVAAVGIVLVLPLLFWPQRTFEQALAVVDWLYGS